jgi:hypothetical protein
MHRRWRDRSRRLAGVAPLLWCLMSACSGTSPLRTDGADDVSADGSAGAAAPSEWAPSEEPCEGVIALGDSYDVVSRKCCSVTRPCAGGLICFFFSSQRGFCDVPQPAVATTCSQSQGYDALVDTCGCQGLSCASDQICTLIETARPCSFLNQEQNRCVRRACAQATDCAPGSVCLPPTFIGPDQAPCAAALCKTDSDCTAEPFGRCLPNLIEAQSCSQLETVDCFYPGLGGATSCGGRGPSSSLDDGQGAHQCAR